MELQRLLPAPVLRDPGAVQIAPAVALAFDPVPGAVGYHVLIFLAPVNAIDGSKLAAAKEAKTPTPEQKAIVEADRTGDRKTLKADSFIPAAMAVIFLGVLLYFKAIGGYKVLKIEEQERSA